MTDSKNLELSWTSARILIKPGLQKIHREGDKT